jgi:hypothetical protein
VEVVRRGDHCVFSCVFRGILFGQLDSSTPCDGNGVTYLSKDIGEGGGLLRGTMRAEGI